MNFISVVLCVAFLTLRHVSSENENKFCQVGFDPNKITPWVFDCKTLKFFPVIENEPVETYVRIPSGNCAVISCSGVFDYVNDSNRNARILHCTDTMLRQQNNYRQNYPYNQYNTETAQIEDGIKDDLSAGDINVVTCKNSIFDMRENDDNNDDWCTGRVISVMYNYDPIQKVVVMRICISEYENIPIQFHHKIAKMPMNAQYLSPYLSVDSIVDPIVDESIETVSKVKGLLNYTLNMDDNYLGNFGIGEHFVVTKAVPMEDFSFFLRDATRIEFNQLLISKRLSENNWQHLQNDIRSLGLGINSRPLNIYTGTYGVLQFPLKNGKLSELFYINTKNYEKRFAVPEYIWKIVVDEEANKAVAFVAYNSPHLQIHDVQSKILCRDICNMLTWLNDLKDKHTFLEYGLIFCCEVRHFQYAFDYVPEYFFNNLTILTG